VQLASTLKDIPPSHVVFVQYPGTTGGSGIFSGKVQPTLSQGDQLINLIKEDKPFTIGQEGNDRGSTITSTAGTAIKGATVLNGFVGQSAATQSCSKTRPLIDQ
jgi:hypothetical protein